MKTKIQKFNYYVLALLFAMFGFVACEQETLVEPITEEALALEGVDAVFAGKHTKSIEVFDAEGINSVQLTIAASDKSRLEKYDCNTVSLAPRLEVEEIITNEDRTSETEDESSAPQVDFYEHLDDAIIIKIESQNLQESTKGFDININTGEQQLEERNTIWYYWIGSNVNRRAYVVAPSHISAYWGKYYANHYQLYNGCNSWCFANGAVLRANYKRSFYDNRNNNSFHAMNIGHQNNNGSLCGVTFYRW